MRNSPLDNRYGRAFSFNVLLSPGRVTRMTDAKTTRELVYETNRDVKWICRALQRMEAQDAMVR